MLPALLLFFCILALWRIDDSETQKCMHKKLILLFFILQLVPVFAQDKNIQAVQVSFQKMEADDFVGYDVLGFGYFIKDNVFYKRKDDTILEYKNPMLGKISKVDLHNPLKIVLFYENFNTIITLDNQLIEMENINFSKNPDPILVTATGIASQNRLWIYNSLTQEIGLFDYLKNTYQSISPLIQGNLKQYDTDFNTFQWIDENRNWYSCTVFGKITSIGKVSYFDQIQFISSQLLLFSKDRKLYIQDLKNRQIYTIGNVENSFKKFYYKDQILSIFTNHGITNYKISIP